MAFSLNRVQLIGNLGRDAETRFSRDDFSITSFSLATTNSYKGKDGNWVNETTWHNIVVYNAYDYQKEYLKKGKKVFVEGRLRKNEFNDKDGNKRSNWEVVMEKLIPFEGRDGGSQTYENDSGSNTVNETPEDMTQENNDDLPF